MGGSLQTAFPKMGGFSPPHAWRSASLFPRWAYGKPKAPAARWKFGFKDSATACGRIGRSKSATACGRNPVGTQRVAVGKNLQPDSAPLVCPQDHRTWLVASGAHAPH